MTLSDLLRQRMDQLGLTSRRVVAQLLGIDTSTLGRWLGGSIVPSDRAVPVIADFLTLPEDRVAGILYEERRRRERDAEADGRRPSPSGEDPLDAIDYLREQLKRMEAKIDQLQADLGDP